MIEDQNIITQDNVNSAFILIRSYLQLLTAVKQEELPEFAVNDVGYILLKHLDYIEEAYSKVA